LSLSSLRKIEVRAGAKHPLWRRKLLLQKSSCKVEGVNPGTTRGISRVQRAEGATKTRGLSTLNPGYYFVEETKKGRKPRFTKEKRKSFF